MAHDFQAFFQLLAQVNLIVVEKREFDEVDQATCFSRQIWDVDGYRGDFPCFDYQCPGCDHALMPDVRRVGFPFELESEIGSGGFARVFKELSLF